MLLLTRDSIEVEITLTSTSTPYRCCAVATYLVTSPRPLLAEDLDEIRASPHIMAGQETGLVTKSGVDPVTGRFYYHLRSLCDSSD